MRLTLLLAASIVPLVLGVQEQSYLGNNNDETEEAKLREEIQDALQEPGENRHIVAGNDVDWEWSCGPTKSARDAFIFFIIAGFKYT